MCIFSRPKPPPTPPPLPPAPPAPAPPPVPEPVPEMEVKPVNPMVKQAQSKLGTKKGKKGSTGDLMIKKPQNVSGSESSLNVGNVSNTGGLQ